MPLRSWEALGCQQRALSQRGSLPAGESSAVPVRPKCLWPGPHTGLSFPRGPRGGPPAHLGGTSFLLPSPNIYHSPNPHPLLTKHRACALFRDKPVLIPFPPRLNPNKNWDRIPRGLLTASKLSPPHAPPPSVTSQGNSPSALFCTYHQAVAHRAWQH